MKHNTLSVLIALALISATVVSCGETAETEVTTAPESTTDTDVTDGIPELPERDLEGFTLSMGKPVQDNIAWSTVTFAPAEENGEILNDAIHRRNTAMYEYMTLAAVDLNSDGRMDYQDVFSLMYNTNSFAAYLTSQNVKLIDSEGNLGVFDERFNKAYENILKIFDRNLVFHYNDDKYPGLDARQAIVTMFDNKQALFFENGMSAAAQYIRDVQNVDFGFLPLPKLDAAQDKYYSYVSVSAPVLCVPVTTTDRLANTGFVLEALCRESSKSVVPEYFETCFSSKYTHDEESYDMILLATESRMYDLGIIFDYGKILTTITNAAKAGDTAITSKLESIREAVVAEFNENR